MSKYIAIDGAAGEQLASNQGWGEFGRWVDGLDAGGFPQVVHLWEHGWCQRLPELAEQLQAALAGNPPSGDVAGTAFALIGVASANKDSVLTITG